MSGNVAALDRVDIRLESDDKVAGFDKPVGFKASMHNPLMLYLVV